MAKELVFTETFKENYRCLSENLRDRFDDKLELFLQDPKHPFLNIHRYQSESDFRTMLLKIKTQHPDFVWLNQDYDKQGLLLGIELLGPSSVSIVDKLAKHESLEIRKKTKRFMRDVGPRKMVAA